MSMKLMVRVMEEIEVTRPQQLVLLSMAENARDDGSKCFPSVDLIAWKAGYKPRAVIDIMRDLRKVGIIEEVNPHRAQRATEYQIHLDKAPQKPTFDEWQAEHGRHANSVRRGAVSRVDSREVQSDEGCNLTSREVQSHVREVQSHVKNTRENAPEPVREPVKGTSHTTRATYPDDFEQFWSAFPTGKGNKKKSYEQWKRLKPNRELFEEIMTSLERWKACGQWQRGFITHAERCLRDRFWENEPPQDPAPQSNITPFQTNHRSAGRRGYTADELLAMSRGDP